MKVGDLVRRKRYRSPDGRITGRSGKEPGVGLVMEFYTDREVKIKWLGDEAITWITKHALEVVSEA